MAKVIVPIEEAHLSREYKHLDGLCLPVYIREGVKALQKAHGFEDEKLAQEGLGFFLDGIEKMKMHSEISVSEKEKVVRVDSRFSEYDGLTIRAEHEIFYEGRKVAEATTRHYFVRYGKRKKRIVRRPSELIERFGILRELEE